MGERRRYIIGTAIAVVICLLQIGATTANGKMPLPSEQAMQSIEAKDLRRHLEFLASDELGGRFTLSPSNRIAARYLAGELKYYGYRGAGQDGSYFQPVPVVCRQPNLEKSYVSLVSGDAAKRFKAGDDFAQLYPYDAHFSGNLVFVGYGISAPERGEDDYAGLDVKGKVIVRVFATPSSINASQLRADERGEKAASVHGAIGSIVISPAEFITEWPEISGGMKAKGQPSLPPRPGDETTTFPAVYAGPDLINTLSKILDIPVTQLEAPEGKKLTPKALATTVDCKVIVDSKPAPPAQNVAAILDGTDPVLKDQFVVFSAHYDHLETVNGQIYNGADDDGSGTVSVLEIAKALTIDRPRRSILIIFHTGEELGLFGSTYNTDYSPVVPLNRIVADLNIDMVGRSRPKDDTDPRDAHLTDENSIYLIGADKLSTELNKLSEETDADTVHMKFDYTYNSDNDPERFYYRSDHYNYAKHGIPVIFYFTGVHRDYHEPTDDVEKIDFAKMERIDKLIFATGWRIANLDHKLVVDKKVPAEVN